MPLQTKGSPFALSFSCFPGGVMESCRTFCFSTLNDLVLVLFLPFGWTYLFCAASPKVGKTTALRGAGNTVNEGLFVWQGLNKGISLSSAACGKSGGGSGRHFLVAVGKSFLWQDGFSEWAWVFYFWGHRSYSDSVKSEILLRWDACSALLLTPSLPPFASLQLHSFRVFPVHSVCLLGSLH